MVTEAKNTIEFMLRQAYCRLGVQKADEQDVRIQAAMEYLSCDREHYIELVEQDTPEHYIDERNGVVCKLIPLAQLITEKREEDHLCRRVRVLSVMVAPEEVRCVYADSYDRLYENPADNTYTYPVYNYAELEGISDDLQICDPQTIRPVATERQREIYGSIFAVFERLCRKYSQANTAFHKTERAMLAAERSLPAEFAVGGDSVSGKGILLATENAPYEELREDHNYKCYRSLHLLITETKLQYLMQTQHQYHYFRKEILGDEPGACIYEPTEEKCEITGEFVTLEEIPQDMCPLYY